MNIFGTTLGAGVVLLFLGLIVFWPFVIIWSLNTLFPVLAIPFTFWTWLGMLVITATFASKSTRVK
jgi:hypothetical protein